MSPSQRKTAMFVVALLLTVYEAVLQQGERPFLLTLYATMMGVPLFLGDGSSGPSKPAT